MLVLLEQTHGGDGIRQSSHEMISPISVKSTATTATQEFASVSAVQLCLPPGYHQPEMDDFQTIFIEESHEAHEGEPVHSRCNCDGIYGTPRELQPKNTGQVHDTHAVEGIASKNIQRSTIMTELKSVLWLSIPSFISCLLEVLPLTVSIIQVGNINSLETQVYISSLTMAGMLFAVTGYSTGYGMATALDTLCSQAYGSGQIRLMGIHLQTGLLVLSILFGFVFLVNFYYSCSILLWLRQPAIVSQYASLYIKYLLPGLPFSYVYEMLKKILVAQNIAAPMVMVALVANVVNFGGILPMLLYTT